MQIIIIFFVFLSLFLFSFSLLPRVMFFIILAILLLPLACVSASLTSRATSSCSAFMRLCSTIFQFSFSHLCIPIPHSNRDPAFSFSGEVVTCVGWRSSLHLGKVLCIFSSTPKRQKFFSFFFFIFFVETWFLAQFTSLIHFIFSSGRQWCCHVGETNVGGEKFVGIRHAGASRWSQRMRRSILFFASHLFSFLWFSSSSFTTHKKKHFYVLHFRIQIQIDCYGLWVCVHHCKVSAFGFLSYWKKIGRFTLNLFAFTNLMHSWIFNFCVANITSIWNGN